MIKNELKQTAFEAVKLGWEFYLNNQNKSLASADYGRFPYIANCEKREVVAWTTNWLSGIQCSVMLNAYQITGDERFLDSARAAVVYLKSLQEFSPWAPQLWGTMHECTPQDTHAFPRDGLSAALGLLDFARIVGDENSRERARIFGDWFISYGMEKGYPYWKINFDSSDRTPDWYGSFHSGSAYFLTRLYEATGDPRYLASARQILDFYNTQMLSCDGGISVIRHHDTLKVLDAQENLPGAPVGWIKMHQFNDDFGALANMHLGRVTGQPGYSQRAVDFLKKMKSVQRPDGGFGPIDWAESIPNAAGMILIEIMNARRLNLLDDTFDPVAERCAEYLISKQFKVPEHPFYGAFHGVNEHYHVDPAYCNARATTYAILALMNFVGAEVTVFKA